MKDPKGVLASVAKLGYKQVETFGYNKGKWFGLTPAELKAVLKRKWSYFPKRSYFRWRYIFERWLGRKLEACCSRFKSAWARNIS